MDISTIRYRNLRATLAARKLKLKDLAAAIERSDSQVSSFAGSNPQKKIGETIARLIETKLALPPYYLDNANNLDPSSGGESFPAEESNASILCDVQHLLPVVGMTTAGKLIENFNDSEIEEYVPAPGPCGRRSFVLRLEGISMMPRFHSGDRIVIDPDAEWLSGDFVFARRFTTDSATPSGTFKQIRYEEGEFYLCAINEQWSPRYTRIDSDWEVVGKALYRVEKL